MVPSSYDAVPDPETGSMSRIPPRTARILVVDDEQTVGEVLQEFLIGEGYEISLARSGDEAVRMLGSARPDVILTDINMPGLSGLEMMRFAKEADPDVCVVVLTGHASTATAIDALRQGAFDYVTKPFVLDAVLKIVKNGLQDRSLRVVNRELVEELRRKNEILRHHEQELRERVRIATHQLRTLYESGKDIGADLELGPRLGVICAKAAETTRARGAVVFLKRETEGDFVARAAIGVEGLPGDPPVSFVPGETDLGLLTLEPRAARLNAPAGAGIPVSGVPGGAQTLLAMPMVAEGSVMGVLAVLDKPEPFDADDEDFLEMFAPQAAIAIRNSQLFENTKSLDRMKSEFVAVVSHEIRTPLTSVKGAVELLTDDRYFQNNDQQLKLLAIAHANTERLLTLIGDILDFSKLESGSMPMHFERERLEPVIEQATSNLRTLLEEKQVSLDVQMSPDLPDVLIDPSRIAQVITNLMSNAIKFSPPEGQIEVFAEVFEGCVRVGVRDHGEGIAPHDLPKLFQRFSQIDSTSTRRTGGTGLGLVICKGIVEQHGGSMSVDSAEGAGSTFYFTLPPAVVPAEQGASQTPSAASRAA
jgi:signal transduction histidine kinase/DNA-binding response OmpR family regulator